MPSEGSQPRTSDGSAGDADYGLVGGAYSDYRRADPRIAAQIEAALGDARTVLNVGAGTGNYEPRGREVTAVEPSATMREQRPPELPHAIDTVAQSLPFEDLAFDAAMASFSVHQWGELDVGLAEVRRVTRGPVVIMTCDPVRAQDFWITEYCPTLRDVDARRFPSVERIATALGGDVRVEPVPVPLDCTDGFIEAYYGRPEAFLDADARRACSGWAFVPEREVANLEQRLRTDLDDGAWDRRYGQLRSTPTFEGSLVLVVSERA